MASDNTSLIDRIRARSEKLTEFHHGILTADRWVKNMQQVVGLDTCYKFASSRSVSYDDALRKASRTLTYSNEDMVVEQKQVDLGALKDVELPKNTLMAFRHVLTTPRKDRDGDVLRTEGAVVDPKMLLLWQHVHTLPIGKMLAVVEHNPKKLVLISAIVDMNELSHDAAVMVDNDMARFSHGFRALEFEELKETEGEVTGPGGFDVKRFEIMEESVVSVPSNADAEVAEVLVSLVEGGKLTSGIMKEYGKTIRNQMPIQVAVGIDLTKGDCDENECGDGSPETEGAGCGEGCGCTSKEADEVVEAKEEEAHDEKVIETKDQPQTEEKAGRSISKKNMAVLKEVHDDLTDVCNNEQNMSRGSMALCERCAGKIRKMIDEDEGDASGETAVQEITAKQAFAIFLAESSEDQKEKMLSVLQVMKNAQEQNALAKTYKLLAGL